jgi:uncharacterized protein YecT (DUF1311 family)
MRGVLFAAGTVAGLLVPAAIAAQEIAVDCSNPTLQIEMTYCAEQDWLAADAGLNAAWAVAMAEMRRLDEALAPDQRGAAEYLRRGQRAWITFRDETCAAEGFRMRGGSGEAMLIYACRARLTAQRVQDLEELAVRY